MIVTTPRVAFVVPGRAQPAGSKRAFVNRKTGKMIVTDANPNAGAWKERVALAASAAFGRRPLLDEPLVLEVTVLLVRPAGHFGARGMSRKGRETPCPVSKPDLTKLVRAIEDALTGVVWVDDSRVVSQFATKGWGIRDEVAVCVRGVEAEGRLVE